ncbi:hypothetical protein [Arthrobacter sp. 2MCAF14]|uniref:hypothetical protein n=1 Tax=Arthrobacter sp. 2MCAF14 TaxID=3232982 RepID=UPI003F909892
MKLLTISAAVMLVIVATIASSFNQIIMGILSLAAAGANLATWFDPVNPAVNSWAGPVFAVFYLVLVIVALASLIASKWLPAPVKVAITVAILVLPFAGSIAWIIYSQMRQRGSEWPSRRS